VLIRKADKIYVQLESQLFSDETTQIEFANGRILPNCPVAVSIAIGSVVEVERIGGLVQDHVI